MSNDLVVRDKGLRLQEMQPIGSMNNSGQATTTVAEMIEMAKLVAASHLIPGVDTPAAAFTLMLICQAQGLHAGQALTRYHIIFNRPSMRADAMQAEFQRNGGIVRWKQWDRQAASAVFVHPVHAPEPGIALTLTLAEMIESGEAMEWDKDAINEKGTKGKLVLKSQYKLRPDSMLRARLISRAVRMIMPGVVVGIYTPEEVQDFEELRKATPQATQVQALVINNDGSVDGSGGKAGMDNAGIALPPPEDKDFRAKIQAAEASTGIVRPPNAGVPIPGNANSKVDYTPSSEPIRDDQKQQLKNLVQNVVKMTREDWQNMLVPYGAGSMNDLTAVDAGAIIRTLEVMADGDPFGPAGIAPGTPKDEDPRVPLINEVLALAERAGLDNQGLEDQVKVRGYDDLMQMSEDALREVIHDLNESTAFIDREIPDAIRPATKRTRKPKDTPIGTGTGTSTEAAESNSDQATELATATATAQQPQ